MAYEITRQLLTTVMPRCAPVVDAWLEPLRNAAAAFGIDTRARVRMYIANIAHESSELTKLEEDLHYKTVTRLRAIFPRFFTDDAIAARYIALGPEAIAARVYANRLGNGPEESGDGWTFRARGPNGLTFKSNYMACSAETCGDSDTLYTNPEFVALPEFGAAASAWHWAKNGCNEMADRGDFDGCCDIINIGHKTVAVGDSNGFGDRKHYYDVTEILA